VTAKLTSGDRVDVTRLAKFELDSKVGTVSATGHINPIANGKARLGVSGAGKSIKVPVDVVKFDPNQQVDFIRDVNQVISQLGCSSGSCHGSKDGKAGFKLS